MAYPENYTREEFIPSHFVYVADPSNPPPEGKDVTPEEMNKLGEAIALNRESLHLSSIRLLDNELNANDPVNRYPITSESKMAVNNSSWPEVTGIVKTIRHKASSVVEEIPYDHQEFRANSGNKYYRHALVIPQDAWTWTPNTAYTVGMNAKPTVENGLYYVCSTDGMSKAVEPTWVTTGSFFETDAGGANPTVQWTVAGSYWSDWVKVVSTEDGPASIGAASEIDPLFSGSLVHTPVTQNISAASNRITPNSKNINLNNTTGSGIILSSLPSISAGLAGQEIELTNISTSNITFQDRLTLVGSGIRLSATSRSLGQGDTLRLKFVASLNEWVETGFHNVL